MQQKLIFVAGATGTVGREVVRALTERGARVRALVRTPRSCPDGVEQVTGNLGDPDAVGRALDGAAAAFYVSPHEPDEERLADIFIAACKARQTRLVFAGVHADGRTRLSRAMRRGLMAVLFARAYAPKFRLAERIRRARTETVVLMPTNFFQNDEVFRDELLAGEYVPTLRGINRVDVRDLGDVAARALLDRDIAPGAYPIVGPVSMSSADSAAAWSTALGRQVRTGDFDRFAGAVARHVAGKKQADFLASFRALARIAVPTNPRDVATTTELLGRAPRSYDVYVRDMVAQWTRDVG